MINKYVTLLSLMVLLCPALIPAAGASPGSTEGETEKSQEDRYLELRQELDELKKQYESEKKDRIPVKISGDFRFRYRTTGIYDEAGGTGTTHRYFNRIRVNGEVPFDDSMYGFFRICSEQPTRRLGDSAGGNSLNNGTTFRTQYLYINKKDFLGGDWRLGRQYGRIGNAVLFIDFYDGVTYTRKINDKTSFKGLLISQNTSRTDASSFALNSSVISVEHALSEKDTVSLSGFRNDSRKNKYGVINPETVEKWYSIDFRGSFRPGWKYYATAALYRNKIGECDVPPAMHYLRGDTNNECFVLNLEYEQAGKFDAALLWARQSDNFRAFDVLNDLYYLESAYHPLEDALNALSLSANNGRTGKVETVQPAPVSRAGEFRPSGAYLQDIHGYSDIKISGGYHFTSSLKLVLTADFLKPVRSSYGYRDITAITCRFRYKYDKKTTIELRGIKVSSDYGRTGTDIRSELYIKF